MLATVACLMLVPAADGTAPSVSIDVYADEPPATNATDQVTVDGYELGERYNWTVDVQDEYTVLEMRVHSGFDVDRARQLVPWIDGGHFVELSQRDVSDVDRPTAVFNLTSEEHGWTYELGLPGPGPVTLSLVRDVTPPTVTLHPVRNVTHFSFDAKTSSPEPAMATLVLERPDGTQREQPTPHPGTPQRFPVQGLEADTTYSFFVRVEDWSGNQATTRTVNVTTAPAPDPPEPTVEAVRPAPNSTVTRTTGIVLEASIVSEASPVALDGIQVFFDKERVERANLTIEPDRVLYTVPGPLEPRPYSVSVEVPNEAGGTGVARWSFTVQDETPRGSPTVGVGAFVAALVATAGLAGRRWR